MSNEANIIINGTQLSKAEAMTVRVALSNFVLDLQDGLGDDNTGKTICEGYKNCLNNIFKLLKN
jgi:hypothetical protein